ncbi:MAG TPA: hypothetical protein VE593_01820 [Nitrososphaeraceae archaeon]|jgi:hypothetical protein|nr:hypothetical protein [Nitrososphaeraceae archaeon]
MKFVALASFVASAAFMITAVAALALPSPNGILAGFKAIDIDCIQSRDNSQYIQLYNGSNATIISNPSNIQSCG